MKELNQWLYSRPYYNGLIYGDAFILGENLKNGSFRPQNTVGEIHCYIGKILTQLNIVYYSNKDLKKYLKFILEHITNILLKNKIFSISFGGLYYELNNENKTYNFIREYK